MKRDMGKRQIDGKSVRRRWLGSIGLLGLLMLFSHQNCAPSNLSATQNNAVSPGINQSPDSAQPVTVIDDSKSQAGVSFQFQELEISAQANDLDLAGQCSRFQDGATLGWKINQISDSGVVGSEVVSGHAGCAEGSFHVAVQSIQSQLPCGHRYQLRAQLGLGQPGVAVISRQCASSASN